MTTDCTSPRRRSAISPGEVFGLLEDAFIKPLSKLASIVGQIKQKRSLKITLEACQKIQRCGFRGDNLALAIVATDILAAEQPITLRGLMYRVVSAGWLPSTDKEHYNRLGRLMTRLREAGAVPFHWIVDGVRETDKPSSWSGLADFSDTVRRCYRRDFWASMPHYIHFIVEKDAVSGTLAPVTHEYDVALSPLRGYSSLSFAHEIASTWNQIDKPVFCYFMGDFDPSGFDLERDIREKLQKYCPSKRFYAVSPAQDRLWWRRGAEELESVVVFERVAVLAEDVEQFDLLPLRVKERDKRAKAFCERHGDKCYELDAIPSTELRRRVREIIESHIDDRRDEWERLQVVEQAERETLAAVVAGIGGAE